MAEGHRQRLIEKVLKHGVEILHEHEFLELYLYFMYKRIDTNPIAHRLLDRFGDLEGVCNASLNELESVEGVGEKVAKSIKLLPHISRGYQLNTSVRKKRAFDTRESIYKRCIALLGESKNEVVYILCFDNSMHLIKEAKIAEGLPGHVHIEPRKITDALAGTSTAAIVLSHNHPSGMLHSSSRDAAATYAVAELMQAMGIEFIDHVVVADHRAVSCVAIGEKTYERK